MSLNFSYDKGFAIITNDTDSSVDEFLPEGSVLKFRNEDTLPEIPKDRRVIFDGKSGLDEPVVRQAVERADTVIIPVAQGIYGVEELKRGLRTIREVEALNQNIVVVANMLEKGHWENISKVMEGDYEKYPMFPIRKSRYVAELIFTRESIRDKYEKGGLIAYHVKDVHEQFQDLFDYLDI